MTLSLFRPHPRVDSVSFERETLPHLNSLYRTARRLCGNDQDAEDLVQETYLRAYRFFHQFELGTNCRAWLMRILHNLYINSAQRRSRTPAAVSLEATEDFFLYSHLIAATDSSNPGPEEVVLSEAWDNEILEALDRLPYEFRAVVVLSDVEELQYKEIASVLGIPIGTVRSRLSRGRRMLQRLLWDYMRDRNTLPSDARRR